MDTLVANLENTTVRHVTPNLLKEQVQYLNYVVGCLDSVNYIGRFRSGKLKKDTKVMPQEMKRPKKYVEEE